MLLGLPLCVLAQDPPKTNSSLQVADVLLDEAPYIYNGIVFSGDARGSGFVAGNSKVFFTAAHVLSSASESGEITWNAPPVWVGGFSGAEQPSLEGAVTARGYFRWTKYATHATESGVNSRAAFGRDIAMAWGLDNFFDGEPAIIDFAHEIDGSGGPALCMPAGGSRLPATHETVDQRLHYVKQDGQAVFKFAVRKTEEIARRVLSRNGIDASEIDLFVSHQANRRIITAAAERLGLAESKVMINLEMYGNTTAGTIPLALADAVKDGRLKRGDLVLLASVGAGFTVGAVLLRWGL